MMNSKSKKLVIGCYDGKSLQLNYDSRLLHDTETCETCFHTLIVTFASKLKLGAVHAILSYAKTKDVPVTGEELLSFPAVEGDPG